MGVWKRRVAGTWVPASGYIGAGGGTAMSAYEVAYWQTRAALLDPLAYGLIVGSGSTGTVPTGETWYVLSAWKLDAGTPTKYHRVPNAAGEEFYVAQEGEVITCEANAGAMALYCNPSLVVGVDSRYDTDPRGLYFERLWRLENELPTYEIGHNNTGASTVQSTFPTDFTYGMVTHVSTHDVAWTILRHSGGSAGINLNNEVSDTDRIRFAQRIVLPFTRATFPKTESRGVSQSEGSSNVRYVKLPGDW